MPKFVYNNITMYRFQCPTGCTVADTFFEKQYQDTPNKLNEKRLQQV